ncbi:DUF4373 domain-containing protein [Paenibacillus chibensis]|uniref:DUF4373 domain-containing protein n=1 Tax=Paenibacillus chibensis TaxID=59846 RepID=A0ABU6PUQ8_9BACL|nr:DUF4373 domain-containing protein [Paenibacillus chibensis]
MARPLKESLDYFPLDIDFDQDDKLVVVIGKYGMQGLGVIVKIMGEVYRNGYFYPWTEREHYVCSNRVNVDINLLKEIVNECIKWGFFNQKVYESHNVLTSKGFQKRYIEAAKRRKSISIIEDYLLIDPSEECKNVSHSISIINANGNPVNVYINPDKCNNKSAETPQSKVKESKGKESKKEDKDTSADLPPANPDPQNPASPKSRVKKKRVYEETSPYYRMALYFKNKVEQMAEAEGLKHLTANTNLQSWADDFRKLEDIDKQSDRQLIQQVMDWVVKDEFWSKNVISASSFRDKFPRLVLEMKKSGRPKKSFQGGSNKPHNPVVEPTTSGEGVSDEEFEALMRAAEEMKSSKGGRSYAKALA